MRRHVYEQPVLVIDQIGYVRRRGKDRKIRLEEIDASLK
jgi:hypothetical protein